MKTQSILIAIAFLIIQATAAQNTVRFSKDLKFADSLNTFYASVDKCNAIRNYYGIGEELDFVSAQNQIEIHNWNYNKEGVNEEGKLVFLTSNKEKIVYSGNVEFEVLGTSLFSEPQFSIDGLNWEALQSNYINVFPAVGDTTVSLFIKGVSEGDEWSVGIEIPIQRSSEIMPDESPWPLDNLNFPYEQVVEFEGEEVRGNVYTKLSEDGIFDKPFIFIEGIDFGNQRGVLGNGTFGWDDLVGGYTEGQYGMLALMPIFLDSILERGHDLVFIDFADGAEDIKKNAALVRKIISLCNEYKVGTVENIIAGASMGGIVARVALREMELSNICHNCSNYICLDSPHLGANIPLALQSTIYFLASFIPEASSFVTTKLERPAAMQLLCYQWGASNVLLPTEFAEFQNYLLTLGLPQLTRNIAIANGSGSGLLLYNDASKRLLDEHCNATNWMSGEELVFKLFPSPGSVDFEESTDYSNIIADLRFTEMSWDQWYSPINVFTQRPSVPVQTLPLDYSNGGYSTSVYELVKVFNNSGDFTESCGEINSDQYALKHCFVPLSSALLYSDVTPNSGYSAQASSFDYSIAASELNEPHSHLSWNHIEFLLNILADVDSQQMEYKLNNNQEVTVAHAENVLRPIDVNAGILNFSHENNNEVGEVVAVEMKSNCGEDNYFFRGDMHWNVGVEGANIFSKVSVEDSTRVNILENQKTRIEKNSLISLESGASLVIDGAEMLIKGKLVLNEGSELRLVSGSVFLDGGEIELNGGLIHVVDDFSIQQLELGGKLVCRSGAAVDVLFETGSSLHLLGNPSLDTMLLVKEGCMFNDDGEGGWVEWNSAHVEMENQSHAVSFRKNIFMHSWLMGVHSNFTVQWDDFSFFQSRIKGVNVRNDHGDFVFRQSIAELNKIQVYFGNYRIEGSTLIQSELKSFNLKSRSRILESCFYDSEMAVSDESLIELYVYRSTFSNNNTALNKKGGRLRLRCNLFQSNETGLSLEKGCLLYLSADEAAGYNSFIDQNEAILLSFARTPILFDGENSFENCANIMEGSVVDATCMTQLNFGKQYFDVPPYNLINVESAVSSSLGAPCVLGIILGENTVDFCPQEGGGISLSNSNSKMLKQVIVQPGGIEVEFDSLFSCVSNKFFGLDSTCSIKEGLALLLNGLMQLNTEEANEDDYKVLHSAFYFMSWMLDDMVHRREIILSNNSSEFEPSVESVFKVYNKFSFLASEAGYIHTQFYLELEKIRILEMLGLSDQALYLFENLNQCNVEIGELDFLRFWEKILKNEINGENGQPIGESELLSFGVSDEPFAFGSNVLSPQDVYVYPCIAKSKQMSIEAENFCGGNYNLLGQGIQHYKPLGGLNIDVIFLNGKKQVLVVH